ncbi:D-sedoheptulose-7-phosphate isomerase [Alkalispirochaeta alkalica]|uniref:D-sedoheptulose-7-phosphate isomerase n=1 Tax=Alkalispirochaeta alkalica TaxID=46356 RepID=UPI00035CF1FB|nr:SIS domain-containing protein [Alkalispirochaeta alkalica]
MSTTQATPSLHHLLERYPLLASLEEDIRAAFFMLERCFREGSKLLICGNGGSAADADHIVGELMKGYLKPRPVPSHIREALKNTSGNHGEYLADHLQGALPAISLTGHPALGSAFSNDVAPDMIFAQQLYGYGRPGDVLLGISTSGNAVNVLNALRVARASGIQSIGLTGEQGGALAELCDLAIRVPETLTPRVQELHLPIYHWLCEALEQCFF